MPKRVDHAHRREELAAALWRLVMREGIEAASLRRVAAEAGWSSGSLRHYFQTQTQLLAFAMELVVERITARVRAIPEADAAARLAQALPIDEERRMETQVFFAFTARALVDPDLRPLRDEAHAALRGLCVAIAGSEREGQRLHALVDGLALHGLLAPGVTTPGRQLELLREQLEPARQEYGQPH